MLERDYGLLPVFCKGGPQYFVVQTGVVGTLELVRRLGRGVHHPDVQPARLDSGEPERHPVLCQRVQRPLQIGRG